MRTLLVHREDLVVRPFFRIGGFCAQSTQFSLFERPGRDMRVGISGQDLFDDSPVNVGQAEAAALEFVRQLGVVDAKQMKDRTKKKSA